MLFRSPTSVCVAAAQHAPTGAASFIQKNSWLHAHPDSHLGTAIEKTVGYKIGMHTFSSSSHTGLAKSGTCFLPVCMSASARLGNCIRHTTLASRSFQTWTRALDWSTSARL